MLFTWPKRAATGSPSSMRNPRIVDFMCKLQLGLQLDSFHSNTSIGHEMFRKLDGPCASVPLPKKNRHIYIYQYIITHTHPETWCKTPHVRMFLRGDRGNPFLQTGSSRTPSPRHRRNPRSAGNPRERRVSDGLGLRVAGAAGQK